MLYIYAMVIQVILCSGFLWDFGLWFSFLRRVLEDLCIDICICKPAVPMQRLI